MKRSRFFPPLIYLLILAVFTVAFLWFTRFHCPTYSCIGFAERPAWRTRDVYEHTSKSWRGLLENGTKRMRLEVVRNIGAADAATYTLIRTTAIRGLYDTALSPYPGAVSHSIRCDDIYRPKTEKMLTPKGMEVVFFSGTLNDRMQYGTCVDSQLAYRTLTAFFYCKARRTWVQAEVMAPISDPPPDTSFLQSIRCL